MLKFLILFSTDKAKQQAQKVHQIYILSKYVKLERTKKNAQENTEQENTLYSLYPGKNVYLSKIRKCSKSKGKNY